MTVALLTVTVADTYVLLPTRTVRFCLIISPPVRRRILDLLLLLHQDLP